MYVTNILWHFAGEAESQYKEWLSDCYEDTWVKLTDCLQNGTPQCKLQALNALFELLSLESKSPLKIKKKRKIKNNFPVERLRVSIYPLVKFFSVSYFFTFSYHILKSSQFVKNSRQVKLGFTLFLFFCSWTYI